MANKDDEILFNNASIRTHLVGPDEKMLKPVMLTSGLNNLFWHLMGFLPRSQRLNQKERVEVCCDILLVS